MGKIVCAIKGHKPGKRYVAYNEKTGHIYRCTECGKLIYRKNGRWTVKK